MSQSLDRVIKRIGKPNRPRIKFLNDHPARPNTPKATPKPNLKPMVSSNAEGSDMWKINWMIEYDTSRQQLKTERASNVEMANKIEHLQNTYNEEKRMLIGKVNASRQQLKTERATNVKMTNKIEQLHTTNKQQKHILVEVAKRLQNKNELIQQLVQYCSAQNKRLESNGAVHSLGNVPVTENATVTEPVQETKVSNKAKTQILQKCQNCTYSTNKKSTLVDHLEFCGDGVEKNMICNICGKCFY